MSNIRRFMGNTASAIPSDTVLYLPFNNNITDYSSNGFVGTNNGCTFATGRKGVANSALSLNGTSNYINFGDILDIVSNNRTYSIWVYTSNLTTTQGIIGKYEASSAATRNFVYMSSAAVGKMRCISHSVASTSTASMQSNTWTHICATIVNNSAITLYINGVLDSTIGAPSLSATDTHNFQVGALNGASFYTGRLQDARVYNRALTQIEITALYNE